MAEKLRLQKYLSSAGVASRRKAEEMISSGRVSVNGRRAEIGDSVLSGKDLVKVDGIEVRPERDKIYIALHKPRGFITTMSDERDRKCVAQLVNDIPERVYPVGRLDKDSEGLLLMTNDGEFANVISHPSSHIAKTYRVTVRPNITEDQLNQISTGIVIDGKKTAPAKVRVLEHRDGRVVLEIVLYEGRNREIRKMCEALGLEVARLKRIAIGPVKLSMLKQGAYRELKKEEINSLRAEAQKATQKNAGDNAKKGRRKYDNNKPNERQQSRSRNARGGGDRQGKGRKSSADGRKRK